MARMGAGVIAAAAGAAVLLTAGAASAGITVITNDSFGSSGGVHADHNKTPMSPIMGTVGGNTVTFSSTTDLLSSDGGGESKFSGTPDLTDLDITFSKSYAEVTFDVFANSKNTMMGLSVDGGAVISETLGKNANKFVVKATGADSIDQLDFTFSPGVDDIREIRVDPLATAMPEPAAWVFAILGLGFLGANLRRRGFASAAAA